MNELATRKCKPCEGGTAPLTPTQAQQLLAQVSSAWVLTENAHAIRGLSENDFVCAAKVDLIPLQ